MKKLLYLLILPLLFACKEDFRDMPIWDMAPVDFVIKIVDEQGVNLLDSTVEGNWYRYDFKAKYEDKTYNADWDAGMTWVQNFESRYYLPHFYGLYTYPTYVNNTPTKIPAALMFGELDGEFDYDVSITFEVPDLNRKYEMALKRTVHHNKKDTERKVESIWTLDGKPIEKGGFKIILPRRK